MCAFHVNCYYTLGDTQTHAHTHMHIHIHHLSGQHTIKKPGVPGLIMTSDVGIIKCNWIYKYLPVMHI